MSPAVLVFFLKEALLCMCLCAREREKEHCLEGFSYHTA